MNIVLVTGGFDPLHSGHIAYFKAASTLGDMLIVGLNSDEWLQRKKGRAFMPWNERLRVVNNLSMVNEVYTFDDDDGSARHFIQQVRAHYPHAHLIFANGGDRTATNIPEMSVTDVIFKFGVGGKDKANSSSWILEEWKAPKTERSWGMYRVIYDLPEVGRQTKVKELTVNPGQSLSLQKHKFRNEFWHVVEGRCDVQVSLNSGYNMPARSLGPHDRIDILNGEWHRLSNPYKFPCRLIEIQYGESCDEEDIERRSS